MGRKLVLAISASEIPSAIYVLLHLDDECSLKSCLCEEDGSQSPLQLFQGTLTQSVYQSDFSWRPVGNPGGRPTARRSLDGGSNCWVACACRRTLGPDFFCFAGNLPAQLGYTDCALGEHPSASRAGYRPKCGLAHWLWSQFACQTRANEGARFPS